MTEKYQLSLKTILNNGKIDVVSIDVIEADSMAQLLMQLLLLINRVNQGVTEMKVTEERMHYLKRGDGDDDIPF